MTALWFVVAATILTGYVLHKKHDGIRKRQDAEQARLDGCRDRFIRMARPK